MPHRETGGRVFAETYTLARTLRPLPMPGSFQPLAAPAMVPPRVLAASPANRIVPTCFGPGAARLPPHPASPAPTTRHDLASMRRTGGEYDGCKGAGITWRKKERCHTRAGENEVGYRNADVARETAWSPACAGMTAVGGAGMTAVGQDGVTRSVSPRRRSGAISPPARSARWAPACAGVTAGRWAGWCPARGVRGYR